MTPAGATGYVLEQRLRTPLRIKCGWRDQLASYASFRPDGRRPHHGQRHPRSGLQGIGGFDVPTESLVIRTPAVCVEEYANVPFNAISARHVRSGTWNDIRSNKLYPACSSKRSTRKRSYDTQVSNQVALVPFAFGASALFADADFAKATSASIHGRKAGQRHRRGRSTRHIGAVVTIPIMVASARPSSMLDGTIIADPNTGARGSVRLFGNFDYRHEQRTADGIFGVTTLRCGRKPKEFRNQGDALSPEIR